MTIKFGGSQQIVSVNGTRGPGCGDGVRGGIPSPALGEPSFAEDDWYARSAICNCISVWTRTASMYTVNWQKLHLNCVADNSADSALSLDKVFIYFTLLHFVIIHVGTFYVNICLFFFLLKFNSILVEWICWLFRGKDRYFLACVMICSL